jgi:hypothetical protein
MRNLGLLVLVIGGIVIFAAIFYPETLSVFSAMGQFYSALKLWPIIILMLVLSAVPRGKRR